MRGTSLSIHVSSPSYTGPTFPSFIQPLQKHTPASASLTKWIDASAVLSSDGKEVRVAQLNRHEKDGFSVPIKFAFVDVGAQVVVYEVWSKDLGASNGFEGEQVRTVKREIEWQGKLEVKKHSFQGWSFPCMRTGSDDF